MVLSSPSLVLSGFTTVIVAIVVLGILQLLFYIVSGGIPGTGYYYARRLRDPSGAVRQETIKDLVERGDQFAMRLLIKALDDREVAIRVTAIEGLGRFQDPGIVDPLLKHLTDASLIVQIKAIEALGKVPGIQLAKEMVGILKDGDPRAKLAALRICRDSQDPQALPVIAKRAMDLDETVASAAASVLKFYGTAALAPLAALLPDSGEYALRVVRTMIEIDTPAAQEPLRQAFRSSSDTLVLRAILEALVESGRPGTAEFLIPYLSDTSCRIREAIVELIAFLRHPACLAPLCRLLSDPGIPLRQKAVVSLNRLVLNIPDYEIIDPLCEALLDPDIEVRRFAANALSRIGGEMVQERVIKLMWGEEVETVTRFIEQLVGTPLSRLLTFEDLLLAVDRVLTNQRPSDEMRRAIDYLESLMIVLHGANVRGQRVDEQNQDLLIKGRRMFYPLRPRQLHPLAAGLLEFVSSKPEGDRWRVASNLV